MKAGAKWGTIAAVSIGAIAGGWALFWQGESGTSGLTGSSSQTPLQKIVGDYMKKLSELEKQLLSYHKITVKS